MSNPDLAVPKGLSEKGREAVQIILDILKDREITYTGGSKAFYSPAEWKAKGEQYCQNALLVVVYDGSAVAQCFEYAKEDYAAIEAMDAALRAADMYPESGTHVYAGIYPVTRINP